MKETDIVGGRLWRIRKWLFVIGLLFAGGLAVGVWELSQIPLPSPHPLAQTSYVYDGQGKVLASFSEQNRTDVNLSQVSPIAIDAVISTEDRHFYTEGAINPVSILRAAISDAEGSGSLQGASTITQQYVKQTYLTAQRTLTRKVEEAVLAVKVSQQLSKNQILQGYLNTIYWGRGAYGIDAAAETYFGVPASQLDVPEAALLAGMIREPDLADPAVNATVARQNQTDTLAALVRDRHITKAQADAAAAIPFSAFVKPVETTKATVAPAPAGEDYFVEAVRQELVNAYGANEVDGGGLRVYTSLDPTMQSEAYNTMYGPGPQSLDPAAGTASGAIVSLDDNGEVKAMVGGQSFQGPNGSSVNLALGQQGGGSGRQPGSTFKGIMLAELIKLGYSPASVYPAPPVVEFPSSNGGKPYTVINFEHEATGAEMSITDATALSVNTVYTQVALKIGTSNLDAMAVDLGIPSSELTSELSEVLGSDAVSPMQMAAVYATFADNGIYHQPLLVTRVTDSSGRTLPLPVAPVTREILTPSQDAELTYVLEQVVLKGTGTAAGGIGSEVAGKTGTTDNSTDAWFIGYTPNITTALWMGYASGSKPMTDYYWDGETFGSAGVEGGSIPATLWHNYMAQVMASDPQYAGNFTPVYYLAGATLAPPGTGEVLYPDGLGTTTTSVASPPTTSATTSATTPSTISEPSTIPPAPPPSTVTPSTTTPSTRPATTTTVGTPPTTVKKG